MHWVTGVAAVAAGAAGVWGLTQAMRKETGLETESLSMYPELERLVAEFRDLSEANAHSTELYQHLVGTADTLARNLAKFERADQFSCNRLIAHLNKLAVQLCTSNPHNINTNYLRYDIVPNLEQHATDLLHNAILS